MVQPSRIVIKMYLDSPKFLADDFIISSLNTYWSELGAQVVKSNSLGDASFAVTYIQGICREPIRILRMNFEGAVDLPSITIDSNCIDDGYRTKFPAAASHALANLLGVEGYPSFCSDGIMASSIRMMAEEIIPKHLSEGDKKAYAQRATFVNKVGWGTICEVPQEAEKWESGVYSATEEKKYSFSVDSVLADQSIETQLNSYFKLFGRKFEQTSEAKADFRFKLWDLDESESCSPTAMAFTEKGDILLKPKCLKSTDPNFASTVVVHETAHLFGMIHIPSWCGNAIMQPFVNAGPSFTPADVSEWKNRDIGSAILH